MDLSKLPKMGQTPATPVERETPIVPDYGREERVRSVGAAWFSGIVGLLCVALGWSFAKWLAVTLTGGTYSTGLTWGPGGPKTGPVGFFELTGGAGWTYAAVFALGVALLFDAAVFVTRARWLVGVALGFTALATVLNAGVAVYVLGPAQGGVPLFSILAVAVGGYMCFEQVELLKRRQ